jgi:hypothetical protein
LCGEIKLVAFLDICVALDSGGGGGDVETWRRSARQEVLSNQKGTCDCTTSKEKTNTWQLLLDHVAQQASHEGFPSWLFLPELRIKAHNKLYHKSVFPLLFLFFYPPGPQEDVRW